MKNKKHDDRSRRNQRNWRTTFSWLSALKQRWPKTIAFINGGIFFVFFLALIFPLIPPQWYTENEPIAAAPQPEVSIPSDSESPEELAKIQAEQNTPDARKYRHQLRQEAHMVWGLDAPVSTFAAQIHQESMWNETIKSRVGAEGLSQFMPATATWISRLYDDLKQNQPTNPIWSMRALVRYDKFLYDRVVAANPCERMAFALSAYNGGLGWVFKRKEKSKDPLVCFNETCDINPGITPGNQKENVDYPRRILLLHAPLYVRDGWGPESCKTTLLASR
ncbi:transglycosylase SLT domain-containing protein [Glaciimonas soli]|nr:lytic transglycosylase domain-containing protein [Glaciimonas soli]